MYAGSASCRKCNRTKQLQMSKCKICITGKKFLYIFIKTNQFFYRAKVELINQAINSIECSPLPNCSFLRLWFADLFFHEKSFRERCCTAISTAAGTYILQDGSYYRGKWHSVFQMTRRYAWQRHTTRAVHTFIRLRSRTRQSATAGTAATQSFNPTLRPFLYSRTKLTCGMSKLPLCRSTNNIQLTRSPRERTSLSVFP